MIIVDIIVGIVTGILSGFGVGGGSILILYLTSVGGIDQTLAGGINLLYFISCAPSALIGHVRNRMVSRNTVLWCVVGGIPTAIIVAIAAREMESDLIRRMFGVFMLCIGIHEWRIAKRNK